jgi:hypothetical protein
MPIKIRYIIETAIKTDHFGGQLILNQKTTGMTNPDLDQKIVESFFSHQFKITAERSHT